MSDTTHSIAARFWVRELLLTPFGGVVKLQACTRGPENKSWASATPGGEITMTVNNPDAVETFRQLVGKDVALQFIAVPDDEQPKLAGPHTP